MAGIMMGDFERRMQRIQQQLLAENLGEDIHPVSSGRTLFGIKSSAEEIMEQFAREIEQEMAAKRAVAPKDSCDTPEKPL